MALTSDGTIAVVEWTDPTFMDGISNAVWSLWLNIAAWNTADQVLWDKDDWPTANAGWILGRNGSSDSLAWNQRGSGGTTGVAFALSGIAGTGWRHVGIWSDDVADIFTVYLDGVDDGGGPIGSYRNPFGNNANNFRLATYDANCKFAEAAVWVNITDEAEADALILQASKGFSPLLLHRKPNFYARCPGEGTYERDLMGTLGNSATFSNIVNANAHPRVYYPRSVFVGAAASSNIVNVFPAAIESAAETSDPVVSIGIALTVAESAAETTNPVVQATHDITLAAAESAAETGELTVEIAPVVFGTKALVLLDLYFPADAGGTMRISDQIVRHPQYYYSHEVLDWGSVTRSIEQPAGFYRVGNVTIKVADSHRRFSTLAAAQAFRGVLGVFRMGPEGASLSASFRRYFSGKIARMSPEDGACEVEFRNVFNDALAQKAHGLITIDDFPDLPENFNPQAFANIIFGTVPRVPCPYVDTAAFEYLVAQHPVKAITQVYRYGVAVALPTIVERDYTGVDGITRKYTLLDFSSDQEDANKSNEPTITVDVQGLTEDETTVGRLLTDPTECLVKYLGRIAGIILTPDNVDTQSFLDTRAKTQALGYLCSGIIDEQLEHQAAIEKFTTSFGIDLYETRQGKMAVNLTTTSSTPDFEVGDVKTLLRGSWKEDSNDRFFNQIKYAFARNRSTGKWDRELSIDNEGDQDILGGGKVIPESVEYWMTRDVATAELVSLDRLSYLALGATRMEFSVPAPVLLDEVDLTKIVGITHWQGITDAAAGYVNQPAKIYQTVLDVNRRRYRISAIKRSPIPNVQSDLLNIMLANNARMGPFRRGQNLYGVYKVGDDVNDIKVVKSTNYGASWTDDVDGANRPTLANEVGSFDAKQVGNIVHVATQERTTGRVAYHTFDMSADAWATVNEQVSAANDPGDGSDEATYFVSIEIRSTDSAPMIMYASEKRFLSHPTYDPAGRNYSRVSLARKSGGSWVSIVACDDSLGWNFLGGRLIPGGGGLMHCFFRTPRENEWGRAVQFDDTSGFKFLHNTLKLDNTMDGQFVFKQTLSVAWLPALLAYAPSVSFVNGANTELAVGIANGFGEITVYRFVSAATMGAQFETSELTIGPGNETVQAPLNPAFSLFHFNGNLHMITREDPIAPADLHYLYSPVASPLVWKPGTAAGYLAVDSFDPIAPRFIAFRSLGEDMLAIFYSGSFAMVSRNDVITGAI